VLGTEWLRFLVHLVASRCESAQAYDCVISWRKSAFGPRSGHHTADVHTSSAFSVCLTQKFDEERTYLVWLLFWHRVTGSLNKVGTEQTSA
jgi:hypothetical protein